MTMRRKNGNFQHSQSDDLAKFTKLVLTSYLEYLEYIYCSLLVY